MLETEKGLNKFGKHWRTEARKSLTRQGKRSTSSLYKSLDYNVVVNKPKAKGIPSSFELDLILVQKHQTVRINLVLAQVKREVLQKE